MKESLRDANLNRSLVPRDDNVVVRAYQRFATTLSSRAQPRNLLKPTREADSSRSRKDNKQMLWAIEKWA
jgi:hypothetical protein